MSSFLDCGGGEAADSAGVAVGFEVGNDVNLEVEIGVDLGVSTVDSGVGADDALWVGDGACAGVGFGVGLGLGTISICWRLFRKSSRNRFSSSDDWVKLRNGYTKIRSKSAGTMRPRIRDLSLSGRKISKRCSFRIVGPLKEITFVAFFAKP